MRGAGPAFLLASCLLLAWPALADEAPFVDVTDLALLRAIACGAATTPGDIGAVDLALFAEGGRIRATLDQMDLRLLDASRGTHVALPMAGVEREMDPHTFLLWSDALELAGEIPLPDDSLARTTRLMAGTEDQALARAILLQRTLPVRQALLLSDDPDDLAQFTEGAVLALVFGVGPDPAGRGTC